jgi:polar amino acid transport system substrate-binding protein
MKGTEMTDRADPRTATRTTASMPTQGRETMEETDMADRADPRTATDLVRRRLLAGSAAAAGLIAASGLARKAAAAAAPAIDTSFADFTFPSFSCDDSLVKVQQKGELVLTTSNDWPYSYLDAKTNAFSGIDAEIITYVAKMLKIPKLNVQTTAFDGMIPGVLGGRFDMVGDSIHYTKARAKVVEFSFPTYYYSEWLVVPKGNPLKAKAIADLKGKDCGSILGSNYAVWIQETPDVRFVGYKDWESMAQDIQNGRLTAGVYDQPIVAATIAAHPDWHLELAEGYEPHQLKNPAGYSRYIFRQGDVQLRVGFTAAIQWMEDSGELSKIVSKWGLSGYNN